MRAGYGFGIYRIVHPMAKSPEAVKAASASVHTALTAVSHDVTYLPGIDSMYSIGC